MRKIMLVLIITVLKYYNYNSDVIPHDNNELITILILV